jgi:hypothetical protein
MVMLGRATSRGVRRAAKPPGVLRSADVTGRAGGIGRAELAQPVAPADPGGAPLVHSGLTGPGSLILSLGGEGTPQRLTQF